MPIRRAISSPSSGKSPAAGQPLQQLDPAGVRSEGPAQDRRGLVLAAARRKRHAVPERQLEVVGLRAVRGLVLHERAVHVAGGRELVAHVHALVGAPEAEQAPQLSQGLGMILHTEVDGPVLTGFPVARGETISRATDWRPRRSPPSASAASSAASRRSASERPESDE